MVTSTTEILKPSGASNGSTIGCPIEWCVLSELYCIRKKWIICQH